MRVWLPLSLMACAVGAHVIQVASNDGGITYTGRFSHDNGVATFSWSGSQISLSFKGATAIAANMSGSYPGDRYLAILDGTPGKIVEVKGKELTPLKAGEPQESGITREWGLITLVEGLTPEAHTLTIWKLSEANYVGAYPWQYGAAAFAGFHLTGAAAHALPAPPYPERKLAFIGDSDTAGFCADGKSGGGDENLHVENNYASWSSKLARALNASYTAVAVSGIGLLDHPWVGPMENLVDAVNPYDFKGGDNVWSYPLSSCPSAVVTLIGPNDFLEGDKPGAVKFVSAYHRLLQMQVKNYGKCPKKPPLILVCGGSGNGFDPCHLIDSVDEDFNSRHTKTGFSAHFMSMNHTIWEKINNSTHYQGCDKHYNDNGHTVLKDQILPQVEAVLGWG